MAITFNVDDVTPATRPARTARLGALVDTEIGPIDAGSVDLDEAVCDVAGVHPLISAVHLAFSEHRPLVLTPDAIWITIAQGVAHHIDLHAESLRGTLVDHVGKVRLIVKTDSMDWPTIVATWADMLDAHVRTATQRFFACDFSTTTPAIAVASRVVMMAALRRYFDYELMCICGIPTIALEGSLEDWRDIRGRLSTLDTLGLGDWAARLAPILDQFVAAASGRVDGKFWRAIYSPKEAYGGDVVTGWIAELFPYLRDNLSDRPTRPNPMLAMTRSDVRRKDGIEPRSFPSGLSAAPFRLWIAGTAQSKEIVGGFVGVRQHETTLALEPIVAWAVRDAPRWEQLFDRIEQAHDTAPRVGDVRNELYSNPRVMTPAPMLALFDRFERATLFRRKANEVKVREPRQLQAVVWGSGDERRRGTAVADLRDKRVVVLTAIDDDRRVFIGKASRPHDATFSEALLRDVRPVGESWEAFLANVLESDGAYHFDASDFGA